MSVEAFFTSLSKRQTMLLLTAVTFGGQECLSSLEFLPDDEAEVLRHRAQEMLQIPREKRIPVLVTEIKRLLTSRRGALWAAEPAKLAEVLQHERPVVVEVLLRAFPAGMAEAVRALLPPMKVRQRKDFEVKPEVLAVLRWRLEEVLDRSGARRGHFKFSDVLRLQSRELLTVCDHIGTRAVAGALAGLPDAERDAFLAALPPDQKQLATRYVTAMGPRRLEESDAREVLALHNLGKKGPSEVLRSAGAQRIARACLAQSAEFAARLLEQYRGEFGALIGRWVREERQRAVNRGDGGRTDIVAEMERLEQRGIITKPAPVLLQPKKPAAPAAPGQRPPAAPPPRLSGDYTLPPVAAARRPPIEREPPPSQLRDWVAERQARQAGMPAPRPDDGPRRDPVAERAARRAGAIGYRPERGGPGDPEITAPLPARKPRPASGPGEAEPSAVASPPRRPPGEGRVITSPATQRPPLQRQKSGDGTNIARPPRSREAPPPPQGKGTRGPKGGSG